ncbi:hypothetical protein B0F88_103111 [Methylobacter tundripaludum]|uniref:Uncharacterized protein n=1 Tax=Methylobacter tundripaludum TaxID=173365 RepID=A0A2S6H5B5_9GAMM|nr:hypothetical protein [Methylobacter tundripaludum]PPK72678.1 hypothetical protein B0F88_103111 [Methylobacter tundripaludum]
MSFGIAVNTTDSAGGEQLNGGQSWFFVESQKVILLGDPVQGHGTGAHAAPVMAEGSAWMTLGGVPVCRQGHLASCGHASSGRNWFLIS